MLLLKIEHALPRALSAVFNRHCSTATCGLGFGQRSSATTDNNTMCRVFEHASTQTMQLMLNLILVAA
jgi:hypothetical protein